MTVSFDRLGSVIHLSVTPQTSVFAHGLQPLSSLHRCVELCSGLACASTGFEAAGFQHVCSVEKQGPLVDLHRLCRPGVPVIHGDISHCSCIKEVAQCVDPPFAMMAGFACQPYSAAGSQGGSNDERSGTVPSTVRACYLLQCPLLFVENVPQASTNAFVRSSIQQLETFLGYHLTEIQLKLEDSWCSRRHRWWLVASHPAIGPLKLVDLPRSPSLHVRDVMPFIRAWPEEVLAELTLTAHEI